MNRRLYRSRTNKLIAGVCGGFGEYFGIDPVIVRIVRLIWVLITLANGVGLILYIIAAIVIPEGDFGSYTEPGSAPEFKQFKLDGKTNVVIGSVLILIGILSVTKRYLPRIDFSILWPAILIIIGIAIIYNARRKLK